MRGAGVGERDPDGGRVDELEVLVLEGPPVHGVERDASFAVGPTEDGRPLLVGGAKGRKVAWPTALGTISPKGEQLGGALHSGEVATLPSLAKFGFQGSPQLKEAPLACAADAALHSGESSKTLHQATARLPMKRSAKTSSFPK